MNIKKIVQRRIRERIGDVDLAGEAVEVVVGEDGGDPTRVSLPSKVVVDVLTSLPDGSRLVLP